MVGVVKGWLAHTITRLGTRGDYRLRILLPDNAIVGKGYADAITRSSNSCCGHVVHGKAIVLAIAKRVFESASNYLGIAGVSGIPRAGGFSEYQHWTIGLKGRHIDRLEIDCIRFLGGLGGIHTHTAPPEQT